MTIAGGRSPPRGHVNGDGHDDVIVGARNADANGEESGASYVVFGKESGFAANLDLSDLDGSNGFRLSGAAENDGSGWSVASAGDMNGDRFDDLIVGAHGDAQRFGVSLTANDAGTFLIGGTGADHLTGGAGNDRLNGKAGADVLAGGDGNDIYYVDDANDQVMEGAGGDSDTVYATGAWTMTAGQQIEYLRAYGGALVSGISLTANDLGAHLIGGAGVDHLTGGAGKDSLEGKAGADVLAGGGDDDIYYVDDATAAVMEGSGAGTDTVYATTSWTMTAGQEIENLYVTGAAGLSLVANALDSRLVGGIGNDMLDGGAGSDRLAGGAGDDLFVFGAGSGQDIVEDFTSGSDRLDVSAYGFANFASLMAATTDVGSSAVIALDAGNSIILNGVLASQLTGWDVLL